MLIASLVNDSADREADRSAVIDADTDREVSFDELRRLTVQVVGALEGAGLSAGDRVAVLHANSIEWVITEIGIIAAGMICVPLNARLSVDELRWQLDHSEAAALIVAGDDTARAQQLSAWNDRAQVFAWNLAPDGPTRIQDLSALVAEQSAVWRDALLAGDPTLPIRLMYTSATTGTPKGVLVPQLNLHDNAVSTLANQLQDLTTEDCYYAATPLTHMASGYLWPVLSRGARTLLTRRFDADRFADLVDSHQVTHTLVAPTMIAMLVRHLRDHPEEAQRLRDSSLRAIWYAGSPIPPGVELEAHEVLGPILNQQYGLTELFSAHPAMCCTALYPEDRPSSPGSCGRPMVGTLVRIAQDGQPVRRGEVGDIEVKAREPIGGYWRDTAATEETFGDGWVRTGDIGWQDDQGFVYVSDRKKDMIISGGFNVYSAEVEACLAQHPSVEMSAVVGVPDNVWGEVPWAVVVQRTGSPDVTADELIGFVRERLAHYKAPKAVLFWDEVPISGTGKILKREIRADLLDRE